MMRQLIRNSLIVGLTLGIPGCSSYNVKIRGPGAVDEPTRVEPNYRSAYVNHLERVSMDFDKDFKPLF